MGHSRFVRATTGMAWLSGLAVLVALVMLAVLLMRPPHKGTP